MPERLNTPDFMTRVSEIPHDDGLIEMTGADKQHVDERHYQPEMTGGKFTRPLREVLNELAANLPERIAYGDGEDCHVEVTTDRVVGVTGIAKRVDLYNAGAIDGPTLAILEAKEPEIYVRNILDDPAEKDDYVAGFNQIHATDTCWLEVRTGTICLVVTAPLAETNAFVAVLEPAPAETIARHRLTTVWPGPDMPRLPGDDKFAEASRYLEILSGPVPDQHPDPRRDPTLGQLARRQRAAHVAWRDYAFLRPPTE